jgi:hypothetical protein
VLRLGERRLPDDARASDLAFYGEPGFMDVVAWSAGLALLCPTPDWLTTVPRAYLQRAVHAATLQEAWGIPEPAFVKPALEAKVFGAAVYDSGAALHAVSENLPAGTPVLLAEPVVWEMEYRCFVLERQVVALCPYLRKGLPAQAPDGTWPTPAEELRAATAFLADLLADPAVALPGAIVVDLGYIADGGWAVIEANAAWASGLYGCDAQAVLPVLARAAVPRRAAGADDRPWLRRPER